MNAGSPQETEELLRWQETSFEQRVIMERNQMIRELHARDDGKSELGKPLRPPSTDGGWQAMLEKEGIAVIKNVVDGDLLSSLAPQLEACVKPQP